MEVEDRYTAELRNALDFASKEAHLLGNRYIGTGHLLLGIIDAGSLGYNVLRNLRYRNDFFHPGELRIATLKLIEQRTPRTILSPYNTHTRRALDYTLEEANRMGHREIGTDHLFVGLLRGQMGIAAKVLMNAGTHQIEKARKLVVALRKNKP